MKTILFLLLPIISFAQNQLPDTLFLVDGRALPCFITSVTDDRIHFDYANNRKDFIIIAALDRISLESFGSVYISEIGFTTDEDIINDFIEERVKKIAKQDAVNKELLRLSLQPVETAEEELQLESENSQPVSKSESKKYNRWSFGVLYVPYYSGTKYEVIRGTSYPPDPSVYSLTSNEISMEAELSFGITENLKLALDAGYTSSFSDSRDEDHYRNPNDSSDYGTVNTLGLKILDFNLGVKYYFTDLTSQKVSIYAALGIGRQVAIAQNKHEQLFTEPPAGVIIEDNIEEYTEELNSPWYFNIGFGAEYFFNKSISLLSNIRLLYSSATGKYNSRYIREEDNYTSSKIIEQTIRNFNTRIGLGLNFYF